MLRLAISLAEEKLSEGCHVSIVCLQGGWIWDEPDWVAFEKRGNLRQVSYQGCSPETPLCTSTSSLRVLQLFGQHQHDESCTQGIPQGSGAGDPSQVTTQVAQLLLEALFPERYYRNVPSLSVSNALVTRNLGLGFRGLGV